jgi:hypothetical protein
LDIPLTTSEQHLPELGRTHFHARTAHIQARRVEQVEELGPELYVVMLLERDVLN